MFRTLVFAGLVSFPFHAPQAFQILFDYSYDSSGFFSGPNLSRRSVLEAAGRYFEERINDHFGAIQASGANTWSLKFQDPSTGGAVEIVDPILPADTIVVYVGARDLPGSQLGFANYGYSWYGYSEWADLFQARDNSTNFDSIGGSIAFDLNTSWYFDPDVSTLEDFNGQEDFYTTCLHELGHLLGFGSRAFAANRVNNQFTGAHVLSIYGGPAPLDPGSSHFKEGVSFSGQETAMDPTQVTNSRKLFTELDFAVLEDIGYDIKPVTPTPLVLTSIRRNGGQVTLTWSGGQGPYQAQIRSSQGAWSNIGPATANQTVTFPISESMGLFRVAGR